MNDEHRALVRENFVRLQDELDVNERFLSHFVRNQILIDNQIDEILAERTRYAKTREFLTVIQRRGPAAWDVWYNALIATWQYEVADILKPELAPSRHRGNQEHPTAESGGPGRGGSFHSGSSSGGGGGGYAQAGSSRNAPPYGGASASGSASRGFHAGGHGSPMQQGGYGSPMQQGGYGSPLQQGGYGRPAQQSGYGSPMQQGQYSGPVQQGQYSGPVQQGAYGGPVQQGAYGGPVQQGAYGGPVQQGAFGRPVQQGAFGRPVQQSPVEHRMDELHYGSYGVEEPRSRDSFPTFPSYYSQPRESSSDISGSTHSTRTNQPQAQPADEPMDSCDGAVINEFSDSEDPPYLNGERTDLYFIDLEVKKTRNSKFVRLFQQSVFSRSIYPMKNQKKGRALIIHNQYFDQAADIREGQTPLSHRDGSEIDRKNLKTFFPRMGIEPIIRDDVRSEDILPLIKEETKHPDHKKSDLFVLVIMSHGNKDVVYGADGVPVKLLDIYDKLSSRNFPAMVNKPKIVLIQACAGDKVDEGCKAQGNTSQTDSQMDFDDPSAAFNNDCIQGLDKEDLLIITACFDSYMSMRHRQMGTWFIRGIIDVFSKHAAHHHVEELIKEVRKRVKYAAIAARKRTKDRNLRGQVVVTRSTLTRDLYLFPGLP